MNPTGFYGTIIEAGTDQQTGKVRVIIETTEIELAALDVNPIYHPCRVVMLDTNQPRQPKTQ